MRLSNKHAIIEHLIRLGMFDYQAEQAYQEMIIKRKEEKRRERNDERICFTRA